MPHVNDHKVNYLGVIATTRGRRMTGYEEDTLKSFNNHKLTCLQLLFCLRKVDGPTLMLLDPPNVKFPKHSSNVSQASIWEVSQELFSPVIFMR